MAGPFDDLVGELVPGQSGWLPLDEAGNPTGPATVVPEPAPALACAVRASTPDDIALGHDALMSESGAHLSAPLQNNPDRRQEGEEAPLPVVPTILLLNPDTAPAGVDLALVVSGNDLDGATEVSVNGVASAASGVTSTSCSTTVLAATLVEGSANVIVKTPNGDTNSLVLTVTAPVARGRDRR